MLPINQSFELWGRREFTGAKKNETESEQGEPREKHLLLFFLCCISMALTRADLNGPCHLLYHKQSGDFIGIIANRDLTYQCQRSNATKAGEIASLVYATGPLKGLILI